MRSIELDVVLLAGAPAPAPDALPQRDAKTGAEDASSVDPRVLLLVEEAFRHAKAIGAWGAGGRVLDLAGCAGAPGVVSGDDPTQVLTEVQELMASHRVWERFATTTG